MESLSLLSIHELFEAQARARPGAVAVVYEGSMLTYGQLNAKANQLARRLRQEGVGPDVAVGLLVERSLEMMVGILGILKAGGAYVPIDPEYPQERIAYMLADSNCQVLLTQGQHQTNWSGLSLELEDANLYQGAETNLAGLAGPQNLAYVIYTSGSTGKPKGVAIEHRGVVN